MTAEKKQSSIELCARPYYSVPSALELCAEVLSLSDKAYRLLHQLCALHDGFNNGHLRVSRHVFTSYGWSSHATLDAALIQLLRAELVVQTRPRIGRRPRLLALAWLPITHPEGLTLLPAQSLSLPDPDATQHALRIARSELREKPSTWSVSNGKFVAQGGAVMAHLSGLQNNLRPLELGHKTDLWPTSVGHTMRLWPSQSGPQSSVVAYPPGHKSPTVNRIGKGVDGGTQTTDPKPDPAASKQRRQS